MKVTTVFLLIFISVICSSLQRVTADEQNIANCFVDADNLIVSNRKAKRVFCESADFKSPKLTCISKTDGKQIRTNCLESLMCQDVSEVNSSTSKLRCVEP